jgi:serine-type D-Ala-D-Ala carboxypeptidase (penicillin-binding protein 5/6)
MLFASGASTGGAGLRAAAQDEAHEGARPPAPLVTCGACVVVADNGRVLFGRAGQSVRSNASTTKMITALLVVEAAELDDIVTVSATAASTGGGGLDLQAGDRFSVHDLLYSLLLTSSNDSAVALAEHVAGSEAEFVVRMNKLTRSLGATGTKFVTSHGLDSSGHYSTARDLALFGAAVLEDPVLAPIVASPRAILEGPGGAVEVENRNLLLESYPQAVGIKTGYTAGAGNVLVAAARRRHRTVIAVAMGSVDAADDARRLLDYGFARLERTLLLRAGSSIGALVLPNGGSTRVVAAADVRALEDPARVAVAFEPRSVTADLDEGDPVGAITVTAGGRVVATVDAVAADTVPADGRAWPAGMVETILRTAARATGKL